MDTNRGYYCLIQFCPDPSRAEAVNLGVLLFCPERGFIKAELSSSNQRARRIVSTDIFDSESINRAKMSIQSRLEVDHYSFKTLDDLQHFVDTRANILKLTQPRPIKVIDPQKDLINLFKELVGGPAIEIVRKKVTFPELDHFFQGLAHNGRARLNEEIKVPVVGTSIRFPYTFQNEIPNLVKPCDFSIQEEQAIHRAQYLAIVGDLFNKKVSQSERKNLIVVSNFHRNNNPSIENRINELFKCYEIENYQRDRISEFMSHVESIAHQIPGSNISPNH